MLTEALIEQEIAEGFGDDSLIPAVDPTPPGAGKIMLAGEMEVASFQPVYAEMPKGPVDRQPPDVHESMLTAAYAWRWFPMGGWVYHGVPTRMQREDQGQDFEVPMGHHLIAPSWGKCIHHLSDGPWPRGFGSPYAVVYIAGPCRFKGMFWYLGHANGNPIIPAGEWFHSERILATPNHSMNYGWAWSEVGHAPNGSPGPWGEGARNHWRFAPALKWAAH